MERGKVYKCIAVDKEGKPVWNYIGLTGGGIKPRISVHYNTFKDEDKETNTTLSEQMWEDKRKGIKWDLEWEVLAKAKPRQPNNNRCNICCKEALYIMHKDDKAINSRKELGGYCPHRQNHLISHIKSNADVLKQKAEEKKKYKGRKRKGNSLTMTYNSQ